MTASLVHSGFCKRSMDRVSLGEVYVLCTKAREW